MAKKKKRSAKKKAKATSASAEQASAEPAASATDPPPATAASDDQDARDALKIKELEKRSEKMQGASGAAKTAKAYEKRVARAKAANREQLRDEQNIPNFTKVSEKIPEATQKLFMKEYMPNFHARYDVLTEEYQKTSEEAGCWIRQ